MCGAPADTGNRDNASTRGQHFIDQAVFQLDHSLAFELLVRAPNWVIENRQPVRVAGTSEFAGRKYLVSESVDLPLNLDGDRVDRMLIVAFYRFGRLDESRGH